MDVPRLADLVVWVLASGLLAGHLMFLTRAALRSWKARVPATTVAAQVTTGTIGLIAALTGSVTGSLAVTRLLQNVALQPVPGMMVQLAAALLASWLTAHLYGRYLAAPVFTWFAGKEDSLHGR